MGESKSVVCAILKFSRFHKTHHFIFYEETITIAIRHEESLLSFIYNTVLF